MKTNETIYIDFSSYKEEHPVAPTHYLCQFIWKNILDKAKIATGGQEDEVIFHYIDDWYGFLNDEVSCEECYARNIEEALRDMCVIVDNISTEEYKHFIDCLVLDTKNYIQHKLDSLKGVATYEEV